MKEKVIIKRLDKVLYNGNILDIPIKEKKIIEKALRYLVTKIHVLFICPLLLKN